MTRFVLPGLIAGALAIAGCGGADSVATAPVPAATTPAATATPSAAAVTPEPATAAEPQPTAASTVEPPVDAKPGPATANERRKVVRGLPRGRRAAARPARLAAPKSRPGMRPVTDAPRTEERRRLTAPGGMAPVGAAQGAPAAPVTGDGTGGMSPVTGAPGS